MKNRIALFTFAEFQASKLTLLAIFCQQPTTKGPSNYLSSSCYSSGHLVNLLLGSFTGYISGVHFWSSLLECTSGVYYRFKSGHRLRTSPDLVNFGEIDIVCKKFITLTAWWWKLFSFSRRLLRRRPRLRCCWILY